MVAQAKQQIYPEDLGNSEGSFLRELLHRYSTARCALSEELLSLTIERLKAARREDPLLPPLSIERRLSGALLITAPLAIVDLNSAITSEQQSEMHEQLANEVREFIAPAVSHPDEIKTAVGITRQKESRSLITLQLNIPPSEVLDPRAEQILSDSELQSLSPAELTFFAFLTWQQQEPASLALIENRRRALATAIQRTEDTLVASVAHIHYCYPRANPYLPGLLSYVETRAQGMLQDITGIQEFDDELRKLTHIVRLLPLHSTLEQRSIVLPKVNYRTSPTLKHLFDIEKGLGYGAFDSRAGVELFSWSAETVLALRDTPSQERDPLDRIGEALHHRYKFENASCSGIIDGIVRHRLDSKTAALFFLEVGYQLSLHLELQLLITESGWSFLIGLKHQSAHTREFIDPLARDASQRRLRGSSAQIVRQRYLSGIESKESPKAAQLRLSIKQLLAIHLMDLTRAAYLDAIKLRNLGSMRRLPHQANDYREAIFVQQKVCRTALELFPELPEAHMRLGAPEKARVMANKLVGESAASLLLLPLERYINTEL